MEKYAQIEAWGKIGPQEIRETRLHLAGLPAAIVQKWAALVEEAAKDPAFLEQALRVNKVIAYKGPEAFWRFQQEELKKYLPLATRLGIRK